MWKVLRMSDVYITDGNPGRPPKDMKPIRRRDEILWYMAWFHRTYKSMPSLQRIANRFRISRTPVKNHIKLLLDEGRLLYDEKEGLYSFPESEVFIPEHYVPDIPYPLS